MRSYGIVSSIACNTSSYSIDIKSLLLSVSDAVLAPGVSGAPGVS